jgi:A/G-specific adenine glycosylase
MTEYSALNKDKFALPPELPRLLLDWYDRNARPLPWRRDRDPYRVWVSEVMLQQTGVEVVKEYYARFLEVFPTVERLAEADEAVLLKLWEGLGYYARARNMQKAARTVCDEYGGNFPDTYEALRLLPGVGPYTAGALASICFDLPAPAVDGNVVRVVTRVAGIRDEITDDVKKSIGTALRAVYPQKRRGDFTQSLMELGAVVCLPNGAPKCGICPIAGLCTAKRDGDAAALPIKPKKQPKRQEEHTVFLLKCLGGTALRRREGAGLLGGLWELPNVPGLLGEAEAVGQASRWGVRPAELKKATRRSHVFTHIRWDMVCYEIECLEPAAEFTWAGDGALRDTYSLPTAFRKFLEDRA